MPSIKIDNKEYNVVLTKEDWLHGISVLITVQASNQKSFFTSKICCSKSASTEYKRVSNLSKKDLLAEALQQFLEYYPFEKLSKTTTSEVTILLPWR